MSVDEFKKLRTGRTHYAIRKDPVVMTDSKLGKIPTGQNHVILSISAKAKDGHLLFFESNYGRHYLSQEGQFEKVEELINHFLKKNFPKATEGGFDY